MYSFQIKQDGLPDKIAEITMESSVESTTLNETLTAVFKESGLKGVIMNIQHVEFIESSGLGALVTAYKQCHQKGLPVAFSHPQSYIQKLVGITKLDQVLTLVDSDEKAVEHLFAST